MKTNNEATSTCNYDIQVNVRCTQLRFNMIYPIHHHNLTIMDCNVERVITPLSIKVKRRGR